MKNKQWGSYNGDPTDVFGGLSATEILRLKAAPWRMTDCDPWFRYAIEHGVLADVNGELQLVIAESRMAEWLDLLEKAVDPSKLQQIYAWQSHFNKAKKGGAA